MYVLVSAVALENFLSFHLSHGARPLKRGLLGRAPDTEGRSSQSNLALNPLPPGAPARSHVGLPVPRLGGCGVKNGDSWAACCCWAQRRCQSLGDSCTMKPVPQTRTQKGPACRRDVPRCMGCRSMWAFCQAWASLLLHTVTESGLPAHSPATPREVPLDSSLTRTPADSRLADSCLFPSSNKDSTPRSSL